jgi:hypothetical protein
MTGGRDEVPGGRSGKAALQARQVDADQRACVFLQINCATLDEGDVVI